VDDDADDADFFETLSGWDGVSIALSRCTASIKMKSPKRALAFSSVVL